MLRQISSVVALEAVLFSQIGFSQYELGCDTSLLFSGSDDDGDDVLFLRFVGDLKKYIQW